MRRPEDQRVLRWAWGVALAIAVLTLALLQRARREAPAAATPVLQAPAAWRPALHSAARVDIGSAVFQAAAAVPAPALGQAAPAASASSASARLKPGEFEVCGLGVLKLVPQPTASAPEAVALEREGEMEAAAQRAWPRVLQAMRRRGDVRSTAAAWLLDGQPMDLTSLSTMPPPSAPAMLALVRLAQQGSDPIVMRWALTACHQTPGQAACTGLNARHWVRLQPDNALAWLVLLLEEPHAEAEALAGAARATRFDTGHGQLVGTVDRAIPDDLPAYLRFGIDMAMLARDSGNAPMAELALLIQRCQSALLARDANRRQQCDAIARTMVDQARDLLTFAMGTRLGELAGWPADKVAALRAERNALMRSDLVTMIDLNQPHSCTSVRQLHDWAQAVDRQGELQWLRSRWKSAS